MSNKILGILIVTLILIVVSLQVSLVDERRLTDAYRTEATSIQCFSEQSNDNCTPLGFCIGDNFTSNLEAKKFGINVSGTVFGVGEETVIYDETGNEDFNVISDIWLKHVPKNNTMRGRL